MGGRLGREASGHPAFWDRTTPSTGWLVWTLRAQGVVESWLTQEPVAVALSDENLGKTQTFL